MDGKAARGLDRPALRRCLAAILPDDTADESARDILDLAAALPPDLKRMRDGLEKMLHNLRQEMVESNAAKGLTMGEILEADKELRSTAKAAPTRASPTY